MTVRDLVQKLILESPDLDATVYIGKQIDEFEVKSYEIENISSEGSNDSLVITIKDWRP